MTRIDELLDKATPDIARRDRLRSVFTEWERVKRSSAANRLRIPVFVREEPEPATGGVVIAAVDAEELEQIREELEEAGVPATVQPSLRAAGESG